MSQGERVVYIVLPDGLGSVTARRVMSMVEAYPGRPWLGDGPSCRGLMSLPTHCQLFVYRVGTASEMHT